MIVFPQLFIRARVSKLAGSISSFLHDIFAWSTSRQTWNRFVQECQDLQYKHCLFLLHKAPNRVCPPLSQLHCVFSFVELTRNCSWNTKIATLSWSAHRMLTLSVWFSKESTMLPPQTTKKWSDARLRKALTGWSLYYTRVSSIRSFRAVRSFCGSQQKTCLMICQINIKVVQKSSTLLVFVDFQPSFRSV